MPQRVRELISLARDNKESFSVVLLAISSTIFVYLFLVLLTGWISAAFFYVFIGLTHSLKMISAYLRMHQDIPSEVWFEVLFWPLPLLFIVLYQWSPKK